MRYFAPNYKIINMKKISLLLALVCFTCLVGQGQDTDSVKISKKKWLTLSSGIESNLIQFAQAEMGGVSLTTIPRYTYFFNTGIDANVKLSEHLKVFSGLNFKNIGLIIKTNDTIRTKHRVYTFGAPIGLKVYMAKNKVMLKAGADFSLAFNYKWKMCVNDTKTKKNEFFSDKTEIFFPSVFAGISVMGFTVTGNYYLNNFFNKSNAAYATTDVQLFTLGLGFNFDKNMMKGKNKSSMN